MLVALWNGWHEVHIRLLTVRDIIPEDASNYLFPNVVWVYRLENNDATSLVFSSRFEMLSTVFIEFKYKMYEQINLTETIYTEVKVNHVFKP